MEDLKEELRDLREEIETTENDLRILREKYLNTVDYGKEVELHRELMDKSDKLQQDVTELVANKNKLVDELYSYLDEVPKETKLMIKYLIKLYQGQVNPKIIGSNLVYNEDAMRAVVKGEDSLIGKLIELSRLDL